MQFQSIEEKVIYEKLTSERLSDAEEPGRINLAYTQTLGQADGVNLERLQGLMDKITANIGTMEQTRGNSAERVVFSHRRVISKLVVFAKRGIRRLLRWYMEPPWQQQTTFNNAVTPSIGCITEINSEVIRQINALYGEQNRQQVLLQAMREQQFAFDAELQAINERQTQTDSALRVANERQMQTDSALRVANERQTQTESTLRAVSELQIRTEEALRQKQKELEDLQRVSNERLVDVERKMDMLNKLDLDIFSEAYADPWDKAVWGIGTFAQCGEDMVIAFILRELGIMFENITYIDLGANHAKKLSNTYHFYRHGARGVLVEANLALIPELKFYRNGDVILNRCVSGHSGDVVEFYVIGDSCATGDGLSTPDKNSALMFMEKNPNLKISSTVSVETISVNDIVENYLGKTPTILNIDIEGNELEILKSIDFTKIRPLVVIVEVIPYTMPFAITGRNQETLDCLTSNDYLEYAFTGVNAIFLDKTQLLEKGMLR